jgi:hypothetical protein
LARKTPIIYEDETGKILIQTMVKSGSGNDIANEYFDLSFQEKQHNSKHISQSLIQRQSLRDNNGNIGSNNLTFSPPVPAFKGLGSYSGGFTGSSKKESAAGGLGNLSKWRVGEIIEEDNDEYRDHFSLKESKFNSNIIHNSSSILEEENSKVFKKSSSEV